MKIEIDTHKKIIYLTKETAEDLKRAMKRGNVTSLQALERMFFLEDMKIQTISSTKREVSEEESKINKLTLVEIEQLIANKPEEDQKEYKKFIKAKEDAIIASGKLTKEGKRPKVSAIAIKSWYKKKYFNPENK